VGEVATVIALVTATAAGRTAAARLAAAWPERTRICPVAEIADAWRQCEALVCFLATGATVRLVAPLLEDKRRDPAVVCVDELGRHAVALLGGHGAGANALAERVAYTLGAAPVVTTATDAAGVPGLDTLGWPVEGAIAAVTAALLDGAEVALEADAVWPLPAFPANVGSTGTHRILVTDRTVDVDDHTVVLRPPSLVVGVGASRGVGANGGDALVHAALEEHGPAPGAVRAGATGDVRGGERGIVDTAARHGWPLRT